MSFLPTCLKGRGGFILCLFRRQIGNELGEIFRDPKVPATLHDSDAYCVVSRIQHVGAMAWRSQEHAVHVAQLAVQAHILGGVGEEEADRAQPLFEGGLARKPVGQGLVPHQKFRVISRRLCQFWIQLQRRLPRVFPRTIQFGENARLRLAVRHNLPLSCGIRCRQHSQRQQDNIPGSGFQRPVLCKRCYFDVPSSTQE